MTRLRGLGALTWAFLIQTGRSKPGLFWNLALPLMFLIGLSYVFGGGESVRVAQIVPGILTINLLSASFFGLALHMVSLRERGLYRRLRATPATAAAVVMAHAATALATLLLSTALQLLVAHAWFGVRIRGSLAALSAVVLLAGLALLPLGLWVGGAARDMRSAPMISNLAFFPLMFLSGAAMPLFLMPSWIQWLARALPATYAVEVLQAVILRGQRLDTLAIPAAVLALTALIGAPMAVSLFRWETGTPPRLRPFSIGVICLSAIYATALLKGVDLESARVPTAAPPVTRATPETPPPPSLDGQVVLSGMTILDGSGGRIEHGRIVLQEGRIVEVGKTSDRGKADEPPTDLTGAFVIPGLIDSHVHLGGSAGGAASSAEFSAERLRHDLQVYLACGVTSFVSMTDDLSDLKSLREAVERGTMRAPRPFFSGPGLTAPKGHPAVYFALVPGLAARITRQVATPDDAIEAVRQLAQGGVDLVKFYLDSGRIGESLPVLEESALGAGVRTARDLGLVTTVHVDTDAHAQEAIRAGSQGIEHVPPDLSDATISEMLARRITLTPTLVASEGLAATIRGEPITDLDVKRWVDPRVLRSLQSSNSWTARLRASPAAVEYYTRRHEQSLQAARRAVAAGVTILAGTDAGNPRAFHGLGLLHELELLVTQAGMKPEAALVAATGAAARRLNRTDIGRIAPGAFADLVVLDRDPTRDITAVRQIRAVYFRGQRLDRDTLLTSSPGSWMPRAGVDVR